jgi:hypothetical protein
MFWKSIVSERSKDQLDSEDLLGISYPEILHVPRWCDFIFFPKLASSQCFPVPWLVTNVFFL